MKLIIPGTLPSLNEMINAQREKIRESKRWFFDHARKAIEMKIDYYEDKIKENRKLRDELGDSLTHGLLCDEYNSNIRYYKKEIEWLKAALIAKEEVQELVALTAYVNA